MNKIARGGLGLPIERREVRSVCNQDYIMTTTGYDLVRVLDAITDTGWYLVHNCTTGEPYEINLRYTGAKTIFKRIALANLYGYECMCCGYVPQEDDETLTMDHVIPRANNGWSSLSNLQLLCKDCNVAKADTHTDYRLLTPSEIFWLWAEEYDRKINGL